METKKENKKVELFLDSGAFSAWTQNVEIDIKEYIKFIRENLDVIDVYANLDVIGNAEGTWQNQQIMEKAGLSPLPVFHYGEDIEWLERYLNGGYDYIALGGMVKTSANELSRWLDRMFSDYLTDENGVPKVKVHGFGLTSLKLMLRYPWYSVDSTSWVVTGRMGSIYVPNMRNGKYEYTEQSLKVTVSNRSPNKKVEGQHIDTMSPKLREKILMYIREKGYSLGRSVFEKRSVEHELRDGERWSEKKVKGMQEREMEIIVEPGISNMYQLRDEMNIIYFLDLEKSMPKWPWAFKINTPKSFF